MKYDLMSRLDKANEKHVIVLAEGHECKVNASAPAVLQIQAIVKSKPKDGEDDTEKSINDLFNMIGVALGKDAVNYVKEQEYSAEALGIVAEAITAAIGNESLEDLEKAKEDKTPSEQ